MGDEIARLNTSLISRGVINRRNNFDKALFLRDFDAETTKFAPSLHPHIGGVLRRQIAGMWIKRTEHAVNGRLNQICGINLFNILPPNPFKNIAKQVQLLIYIGFLAIFLSQKWPSDLRCNKRSSQNTASNGHDDFVHMFNPSVM